MVDPSLNLRSDTVDEILYLEMRLSLNFLFRHMGSTQLTGAVSHCHTTRLSEGDHGCQLPLKLPGVDKQLMVRAACTQPWYSVMLRLATMRL